MSATHSKHPTAPPRRPFFQPRAWHPPIALVTGLLAACAPTAPTRNATAPASSAPRLGSSHALLPSTMNDPAEPMNRGLWVLNRGLLEGVIQPTGRVYQAVVPRPVRTSINHFARNIMYPGRLVNTALQGRWSDAGDESLRFLCNTTAGVGGFFDVATRWDMPKREADFGQTFQHWGWKPDTYLMLPVFGPSDEVHAMGLAFDEGTEVWNYAQFARQISYATTYNRLAGTTDEYVRFISSEADPYATTKLAWSYAAKNDPPDWSVKGTRDIPTLQTLGVATIQLKDPDFLKKGRELSVRIPSTGKRMPFNCWLQKNKAPLVYVAPGLGSHRLSMTTLTVAEGLYQNGFSVVVTSSVFHPEFMERASSVAIPAHPPTDSRDLLVALTEIDKTLAHKHPDKFGARALVGCSMGAYQTLYLASREKTEQAGLLRFDRYVAINSPVDLHYGIACLDRFHDAPLAWPADQRQALMDNTVHKVGALAMRSPSPGAVPPFDGTESKFLIGLTFRLTLRDAIFSSQSRHNLGVLQTPVSEWNRAAVYDEILDFSYRDYVVKFAFPYYKSIGVSQEDFKRYGTLKGFASGLGSNPKVRVLTNGNDFLLPPEDLAWLKSNFGPSKLKVFPDGGHLGNLANPELQNALAGFLSDLK